MSSFTGVNFRLVIVSWCCGLGVCGARPGEVLELPFPVLRTEATVERAVLDAEGGVFLWGDFESVDGVSRPGLARLEADGTLDEDFAPTEGWSEESAGVMLFGGSLKARVTMLPLANGGLMMRDAQRLEVWSADGSKDEGAFGELRNAEIPADPQFVSGERVFVIRHAGGRELVAYRGDDGERDLSFQQGEFALAPEQAVAGAEGKIWVLLAGEETGGFFPSRQRVLGRVNADGSWDETFSTVDLDSGRSYLLRSREGGVFDLISENLSRYQFWPSPSASGIFWQRFDGAGELVFERSFGVPFAFPKDFFALGDDGEVIYPDASGSRLIRGVWPFVDGAFSVPLPTAGLVEGGDFPKEIRSLVPVSGGGVLLGGVRRFGNDGFPVASWHVARLERAGRVERLNRLPDGSVMIVGDFDRVDELERVGMARLRVNGEVDETFAANFDGRFVRELDRRSDGNWVAALGPAMTDADGMTSQLVLLDQDGDFLRLLGARELGETSFQNRNNLVGHAMQSDGGVLRVVLTGGEVTTFGWSRLLLDGRGDPDFVFPSTSWFAEAPFVLRDDSFLAGGRHFGPKGAELVGFPAGQGMGRALFEEAGGDVLFSKRRASGEVGIVRWERAVNRVKEFSEGLDFDEITEIVPDDRGKILVLGHRWVSGGQKRSWQVVRLHATGQIDHSFQAPSWMDDAFSWGGRGRMVVQDEAIWVAAPSISGGLVGLERGHVAGFAEWILAAAPGEVLNAENDDPDRDGCDNFEEYAAGTHPLDARSHARPRRVGLATWQVPCNPEAPEIVRRLEGSADLENWATVTGKQVRLESSASCLTWTIFREQRGFFTRVWLE